MMSSATITSEGAYRYDLTRQWDNDDHRWVTWIMLNPSTADADLDDPTIRRCIGFTKRWGVGRLVVVNQFAMRATNPDDLIRADDPRGPENARYIEHWLDGCEFAVAAWGSWAPPKRKVQAKHNYLPVASMAREVGTVLYSLGTTSKGFPRHPLYVRGDTELSPWPRGAHYEGAVTDANDATSSRALRPKSPQ